MPDNTEQPKQSIVEPLTAATADEAALNAPHVPGAGPVILHGARSLTIEFTDGHTIQVSF
jgi:hypothetical protein